MPNQTLMQAVSSEDAAIYTWVVEEPDWAATAFPGPGTALHVAVAAPTGDSGGSGAGDASELTVDDSDFDVIVGTNGQTALDSIDDTLSAIDIVLTAATNLLDGVDADEVDFDDAGLSVLDGEDMQEALENLDATLALKLVGQLATGSVTSGGGTRTLTLTAPASGKEHTYRVKIRTRTGSTYDYYEAVVVSRNVGGTVADPVPVAEPTLPFVNADYAVTFPISSSQVVVTLTNSHGSTSIDNARIRVFVEEDDNA